MKVLSVSVQLFCVGATQFTGRKPQSRLMGATSYRRSLRATEYSNDLAMQARAFRHDGSMVVPLAQPGASPESE